MATILESSAAFNARAIEHGLTQAQLERLQDQGLINLSKLAFSIATPGTVPPDDSLKGLLSDNPDEVTVGQLSSMRRLMFDAQTLCALASQIKTTLHGSDVGKKAELVPAERATRIEQQRARLQGVELTGPLECAHASYDWKVIHHCTWNPTDSPPGPVKLHVKSLAKRSSLTTSTCWSKTRFPKISVKSVMNCSCTRRSLEDLWLVTLCRSVHSERWKDGTGHCWIVCSHQHHLDSSPQTWSKSCAPTNCLDTDG